MLRPASLLTLCGALSACSDYSFAPDRKPSKGAVDTGPVESTTPDPGPTDSGESSDPDDPPSCEGAEPDDLPRVSPDDACAVEGGWGLFEPVVEWQWNDNPDQPGFHQIMSTPMVGNLTDDNSDGNVDEQDIPEVVFTSFSGSAYSSPGALTSISGDGSGQHWSILGAGGYRVNGAGGVAIGDLEGDGSPDICVTSADASVLCLEADGTFKWAAGSAVYRYGFPAIADMDGDGQAEVIIGSSVYSADGSLRMEGSSSCTGTGGTSFAVDIDADGVLELISGCAIHRLDGTAVWSGDGPDGIPAVGDFDGDGGPEVVRAGSGRMILTKPDGTVLWDVAIPGGGNGGAPTVADYDGDGQPEVGVASLYYYTVFETDGSVLWSNPTNDTSSSKTGSSVFDFDRDGAAEVVYADQFDLYVYDGATGLVRMDLTGHANGTLLEYPVIADVDNDGSTEIVLASNNYTYAGWNGITVIGDETGTWAAARPVWNQFAYHITNVNSDSTIPTNPRENWRSWNNFRAGGTELGPSDWLADLRAGPAEICVETCGLDTVRFWVGVSNHGLLDAPISEVVVSQTADPAPLRTATLPALASGDAVWAGPFDMDRATWGAGSLLFRVDGPGAVEECVEDNNSLDLGVWPCE